ncbi:hypothetical protein [Desulfatiglans anilini]|uniref:hypothetical protein n=1 Tax=Desulfatiglans anilini TaxID=90728 RepID=UPI00041DE751|nr:hypothetical protein [Desulfatiglans anilini]
MKILHILKTPPDDTTRLLKGIVSEGQDNTEVSLYEGQPDYEKLIDLIFENEQVISWW